MVKFIEIGCGIVLLVFFAYLIAIQQVTALIIIGGVFFIIVIIRNHYKNQSAFRETIIKSGVVILTTMIFAFIGKNFEDWVEIKQLESWLLILGRLTINVVYYGFSQRLVRL